MSAWDVTIFAEDANEEFLDDLNDLEPAEIIEALEDACLLVLKQPGYSEEDHRNALAAATIAAIWAGAPFSTGDVADAHPYIRELFGEGSAVLNEAAAEVLESVETEEDLEPFPEALA